MTLNQFDSKALSRRTVGNAHDNADGEFSFLVEQINSESKENREKRLATRKGRTLKAFQTTYENHRRKT